MSEYRRIEARKKERDKKTQDLQKLITAADNQAESRRIEKKLPKKKMQQQLARPRVDNVVSLSKLAISSCKHCNNFIR